MALPATLLYPSPLLLPCYGLLLRTAWLLLLRLLHPLLLRALLLQALLLGLFGALLLGSLLLRLFGALLLGSLLLRLFGPLLLRSLLLGLSGPLLLRLAPPVLSALFLRPLRLHLRALLLCRWRRILLPPALLLFRLALFFVLLSLWLKRKDRRPEKQKESSGNRCSRE
jgi:hypothetical protein